MDENEKRFEEVLWQDLKKVQCVGFSRGLEGISPPENGFAPPP